MIEQVNRVDQWLRCVDNDGNPMDQKTCDKTRSQLEAFQKPLTTFQKATSLVKTAATTLFTGVAEEDVIATRLAICQTCDQFTGSNCKLCGCSCNNSANWTNKLAHPASTCPHNPPLWMPVEKS